MNITSCRACGANSLSVFLSLGSTPLANALLNEESLDRPEARFPLDVAFCEACSLVQITETVPPQVLFGDYLYLSSFSDTMVNHARLLAERVVQQRGLGATSKVVEVASNDGYLLQWYKKAGVDVLGIEPATNVAEIARTQRGIPTVAEFFGLDLAERLRQQGVRADVIHANNVLAHVPDINGVVAGFERLLAPSGVVIVEAPYVRPMIEHLEFDTIYHEHLCYFSLTALDRLFRRNGLVIQDVERIPIHGGSLCIMVVFVVEAVAQPSVTALLAEEAQLRVNRLAYYQEFAAHVAGLRDQLLEMLRGLKASGKRLAAYGASAKGSTLLNFCGVGADLLDWVADRSTVKQGRYTPGTHLLIVPPSRLVESKPDFVLLLTWNFADEIVSQQSEYLAQGGAFIVPVPRPEIRRS